MSSDIAFFQELYDGGHGPMNVLMTTDSVEKKRAIL